MPFSPAIFIRAWERVGGVCEMCGEDMTKVSRETRSARFNIHSATSLHLVKDEVDSSSCVVTDPPEKFEFLKGKKLPIRGFRSFEMEREDDGFCLCHSCHQEIHTAALRITKLRIPDHKGKNPSPEILESVTICKIKLGKSRDRPD